MAIAPSKLLEVTEQDKSAVTEVEKFIDSSEEMLTFDGSEIKISIPDNLMKTYLSVRFNVRFNLLRKRYYDAGWRQFVLSGQGTTGRCLFLSQYSNSD